MELTPYEHLSVSDQTRGLPSFPLLKNPALQDAISVPLPRPSDIIVPPQALRSGVEKQRSVRRYTRDTLPDTGFVSPFSLKDSALHPTRYYTQGERMQKDLFT
jgi:hypothetical protein